MREAASSFKDIVFDDLSRKVALGNQLIDGLGRDSSSWSADDLKK